jgi:hypothetical protein
MEPLSPWLYFRRNLRRTLPVLGIIALAVVGVLVVGILADSQIEAPRRDYINPARIFARVYPRNGTLDPNIAAKLRTNPDAERVISVLTASLRVVGLMGSQDRPVRGMPEAEIPWYLDAIDVRLVEGRLPQGSRKEIVLHTAILRAKGLQIGDWIGNDLDPDEWLPGQFQIVGSLEGPLEAGVTTAAAMRDYRKVENLLVFAKPGRMPALDDYLRTFRSDDVDVATITTQTETLNRETQFVNPILWAINGVTILVLSLAVGLLNQIYFLQRIPEYGILLALGYRVSHLIRRTLIEAMVMAAAGWLLGLGVAYSANVLLRVTLFEPNGLTLASMAAKNIVYTLPIPVLIAAFSMFTVIRRLVTLDPVSIVERRD